MVGVLTWEALAYFMALYGTKIFSDLGAMVSNYNTLSDDKILHIDKWSVGVSKEAPELTGGVVTGNTVMNLEYDSDNSQYIATQTGTLFTVKAPALVKGLLNALGAKVTTTNEVSEKIASALSLAFDTSITIANMNEYSIPVLLNNGKTFVSKDIVKAVADALFEVGIFSSGDVSSNINWEQVNNGPNRPGYINLVIPDVGSMRDQLLVIKYGISVVALINPSTRMNFLNDAIGGIYGDFISRLGHTPKAIEFDISYYDDYFRVTFYACDFSSGEFYYYNGKFIDSYNNYRLGVDVPRSPSYIYHVYDNSWSYNNTSFSDTVTIGTLLQQATRAGNIILSLCTIGSVLTPAVDGIDIPDSTTTPRDNDIDIDTTYPEWVQHQIDIGWYDSVVNALRNGMALPIDLNDALTIGEAGEFVVDQATAQTGTLDDTDTTATTTAVQGATAVIPALVTVEGTRVDTTDIPDVIPEPTPPVVIPTGTTSAGLATIYNPTEAQVNALKGELWSQNIITTLQSIFLNNPMDAIISLNKVFCTPHTSGTATVKLGYVQTSVTGVKTVDDQYTTIDCGTVNVPEIYGNTTDYEPYTNVSVFLPFIGIQNLSAKDVIGGKLQIIYRVDVTTGTCIAQLFVTKDGVKQMLYNFEGNCAVEIPLSGSNANRAIIGLASIAASAVAPGAGLALAGGAMNLVNGVNLQRSGGFQSNAGAMNNKKPYLIINRVLPYEASGYNQIYGYPSNNRVLLNSVTGYTRVKDVHVEGINCTDYEKNMIEEQLKAGILL